MVPLFQTNWSRWVASLLWLLLYQSGFPYFCRNLKFEAQHLTYSLFLIVGFLRKTNLTEGSPTRWDQSPTTECDSENTMRQIPWYYLFIWMISKNFNVQYAKLTMATRKLNLLDLSYKISSVVFSFQDQKAAFPTFHLFKFLVITRTASIKSNLWAGLSLIYGWIPLCRH